MLVYSVLCENSDESWGLHRLRTAEQQVKRKVKKMRARQEEGQRSQVDEDNQSVYLNMCWCVFALKGSFSVFLCIPVCLCLCACSSMTLGLDLVESYRLLRPGALIGFFFSGAFVQCFAWNSNFRLTYHFIKNMRYQLDCSNKNNQIVCISFNKLCFFFCTVQWPSTYNLSPTHVMYPF